MDFPLPILALLGVVALLVAGAILAARARRKRQEALAALADRLGFNFSAEDPFGLSYRYARFGPLARGDNRYAYNVLAGERPGLRVFAFDYHHQTYTTDSKGRPQVHHHHASRLVVDHPYDLGRLLLRPEGFLDKVADAFGFDDIDFESAEFSRRYWVKAGDKRLAYDLLHPGQIEFLLAQPPFGLMCEGSSTLVSFGDRTCTPDEFEALLRLAKGFHERVPEYLRKDRAVAPS
ncbi:MAG TPA: hypothetical protein VKF62_07800 [Planctomycetota bacterium]|nr:hypothetical protein [Planctomycetota bacterium]